MVGDTNESLLSHWVSRTGLPRRVDSPPVVKYNVSTLVTRNHPRSGTRSTPDHGGFG